jgi:hypothetical protein
MANPSKPKADLYSTTVSVARKIQHRLKAEQARRIIDKEKPVSMNELASELLTKAVEALGD